MFLSVFDVFKLGIGPSSSHTMGPMTAAADFLDRLRASEVRHDVRRLWVTLHGSLAFTGRGHATDRAVALGLLGFRPADLDIDKAEHALAALQASRRLTPADLPDIAFDPASDIVFDFGPPLIGHANGLMFHATGAAGAILVSETYYSIGGGFVVTAAERDQRSETILGGQPAPPPWPYPFATAAEMLRMARASGLTIAGMKRVNDAAARPDVEVQAGLDRIWSTMDGCIDRGLSHEGTLPGGLGVRRRARQIRQQLDRERGSNRSQPHVVSDWLNVYAMAVNEENAAGGRVVTAPTNGAAGVVPAVIRYYLDHCIGGRRDRVPEFLLTAAAIGGLIKHNASISGAEAGCQGEVGSAAAMAAAGLCAVLDGTPEQVENAAEIALEHHLGMTCDPVGGLVQVPCIERNGIGATKAVAAASLALRGDGSHFMPLDNCIEAMRQTGVEMSHKYKETSLGGLAVNLPEC
ncbi:L-serine ammonia-lyase [Lichenihabitans sp. Uapishka_5]|uniref:L-serine ammonia-lyase n=1 Tax=Lichenihabitans sp. Uapishka_5 TaxID=3037302 RepID=UPI0029E7F73B|nr:L-serine ammonia-lyase [Lichenihabitans sp. Uapishka_5]MDX7949726.1 L-serine ammonia-lyase [Lichenihabitans sp. Uapishka_5]